MPDLLQPAVTLPVLAGEAAAFEAFLETLSDGDLDRPSACSEWTVGDVVGHLTWAGPYFAGLAERALAGDLSPAPDLPPPGEARRQRIAKLAKETRAHHGPAIRAAFRAANAQVYDCFAAVRDPDWDRPTAHRVGPLRYLLATRVNELALHGWDIRSVMEPPGHLRPESLPVLLALLELWAPLLYRPDPAQTDPVRLRCTFIDPNLPPRDLIVEAAGVRLTPAGSGAADATLRGPAEVLPLLLLGRIDAATAKKAYGLTVDGDRAALELLGARAGAF